MGPETHGASKAVSIKKRSSCLQLSAGYSQHVAVLRRFGRGVAQRLQLEMRAGGFFELAECFESKYRKFYVTSR